MLNPKNGELCIVHTLIRVFAIVIHYNLQTTERSTSVFVNWHVKLKLALAFFYSETLACPHTADRYVYDIKTCKLLREQVVFLSIGMLNLNGLWHFFYSKRPQHVLTRPTVTFMTAHRRLSDIFVRKRELPEWNYPVNK